MNNEQQEVSGTTPTKTEQKPNWKTLNPKGFVSRFLKEENELNEEIHQDITATFNHLGNQIGYRDASSYYC